MTTLSIQQAQSLVAGALERNATAPANAAAVARALVAAEADGLKGHGLSRVSSYAAQAKVGKVDGRAAPLASRPRPALLSVDAAHGFAYPALDLAIARLPEIARECGVGAAAIRRSHHCGVAGAPVERLAEGGLVALLLANTPSAMAPWGGDKAVFGTNPVAFACPLPDRAPIVVDLSLSKVARGNIVAAKQRGEAIPDDWAFDAKGAPTTDPEAALGGTMAPLGGAKGVALALMVELLAAGLVGANFASEASSFLDATGGPPGTGQLIVAFDPDAFAANGPARFGGLAAMIEAQEGARLPGRRRLESRARAQAHGLTVAEGLIAEIEAL
ncbi:MAG: Ldh family oxidoreductase [Hyphomicrobiales bacterium]|nr:Ldh family oxidoreductase [Hyphomicrobiales bacterium]